MSVSELADGSDWEGKKARVWKSGETILDTYRVLDVKTGGMGYVYIAEHLKWRSQLAIKAPNEQVLSNRLFFGRVLREADAWINLGMHPHIAFCYYVRQIEGVPHLFIEYVDGGNLRDWIVDQRCYDLGVSLDLAIQFCHGMAYAHHQGMIHRDIKPENILMTKDGHLKVTDFGIARTGPMTDDRLTMAISPRQTGIIGQELTLFGTKMGSFDYMAPEQWEDPSSVDGRADIYSFGVCLYEMICGQKPFESASELAASILAQLEGRAPRDPLSIRSNIPRELSEVLRKCCRLQQDERFASFDQLRMELIGVFERLFDRLPPHAEASAIDPKADGLNNRGVSYLDLGRVDEAEHAWQQALKEDPQHLEATFNLSYLHWQRSEIPDDICLAQLQRLEGRNEKSPDYWRCLAWLHFERGDRQAIAELVEKKRPVMDETFKSALSSPDAPMGRWQFAFKTHPSHVSSVACSPDGLYVLSGCWDETVRLLDVNTWKEAKSFRGHDSAVTSVGFSPDGRLAMSASWDGTVRIWKVSSGREVRRFERHEGLVFTAEFSPDGRRASSGGQDRMVRLWEVGSGKELWAVEGHAQEVNRVCFSPDGQYLLSGSSDRTARLWDLRSRKEVRRFHGHGGAVNTVAFAPDGQHVVTGSADKSIRIWNIQTGKAIRHLLGHAGKVEAIAISLDGRFILSGGADELVRLWETETGKAIRAFDWHRGGVTSVCFSQDGGRVISGSADKTVSVWSISYPPVDRIPFSPFPLLSKVKPVASLSAERETVNQLLETARKAIETKSYDRAHEVLREGQQVAGFHRDPEILKLLALGGTRWGRAGLKDSWSLVILRGHTAAIESVCFSPDNRFLASASADRTIRLWETTSGKEVQRFEGHAGEVRSVCFLADGLHILSGGSDRTARLWEIQSGREIHRLADFGNPITTVSLASSGPTALFAGGGWEDRSDPSQNVTLEVWDLRGRCRTGNLIGHTAIVNAACYSPDSEYIVSGSSDHTVRIWETKGYQQVRQIDGHISGVTAVACAPTGDLILSGSLDETVRLWDFRSGEEIRRLVGHTAAVRSISFTPDGRYALTASDDHTARLWEIDSGKEIHRFKGQHGAIRAVSFSPDARYAASGAEDLTVWVWEFDWHWDVRLVAGR